MNDLTTQKHIEQTLDDQYTSWHAQLRLKFEHTARGTVLRENVHKGPLYVQKPFYPEGRDLSHVYLLHPPGGIVSGDKLEIKVQAEENSHVLLTTPGAGRIYRARPDRKLQQQFTHIHVNKSASVEWFPMETIVYPDSNTKLVTQVHLAEDSKFIGWDVACLGLPANNIEFDQGSLTQTFEIFEGDKLALREKLSISEATLKPMMSRAGLVNKPVNGFMVAGRFENAIDSEEHETLITQLREICDESNSLAGVTYVKGYILVRYVGNCTEQARNLFAECWQVLRPALLDRESCHPRIWAT